RLSHAHGAPAYAHVDQLPHGIAGAVIAAPTTFHWAIGRKLLERGIHLLVEKPLACTAEQGADLVHLAERHGLVLQVGHIEQFNPAVTAVRGRLAEASYVAARRCGPFTGRSTDISV